MKIFLSLFILSCFSTKANCQKKFVVPAGYGLYKSSGNQQFKLEKDLDNDGLKDLVIVYSKNGSVDDNIVAIYLSTKKTSEQPFHSFLFNSDKYKIEVRDKILVIGGCTGKSDYCKTLQFKYVPSLKNLRLIGYLERSVGNDITPGGYLKSVNFVTQFFELSGVQWKNKIREKGYFTLIRLTDIDQATLERFETIGFKYF